MNGVIIVNKPAEFTSFDVIAKLRGILHERKLGHGGTLDPMATGVLPVFAGNATKLCDFLSEHEKTYEAEMLLGTATDSEDIWGNVTKALDAEDFPEISDEAVLNALAHFEGGYLQTPPMVSAKKIDGQKLYDLARKGKTVEREPVRVEIPEIRLLSRDGRKVRFTVTSSKGTYIRTLCKDIGVFLGVPACMSALKRTKHGLFSIAEAFTLEEIETLMKRGETDVFLRPADAVFSDLPAFSVTEESLRYLLNGNPLSRDELQSSVETDDAGKQQKESFTGIESGTLGGCTGSVSGLTDGPARIRVYAPDGAFKAVYEYRPEEGLFKAYKMFL